MSAAHWELRILSIFFYSIPLDSEIVQSRIHVSWSKKAAKQRQKKGVKEMSEAVSLTERYRPQTWSEVVGQDKVVQRILALRKRGLAGRAYWLSGQSGTGKTTIARLIAQEVADEFCIQEVDAAGLTVAQLKDLEREMQVAGWGKGGRAYLVNEAHALRKDVIRQLLVVLERIPSHCPRDCWINGQGAESPDRPSIPHPEGAVPPDFECGVRPGCHTAGRGKRGPNAQGVERCHRPGNAQTQRNGCIEPHGRVPCIHPRQQVAGLGWRGQSSEGVACSDWTADAEFGGAHRAGQ